MKAGVTRPRRAPAKRRPSVPPLGEIAHDFNNILATILGSGRLLLDALDPDDERRLDAQAILDAGERAAALTTQLLMVSRRVSVQEMPDA